MLGCRRTVRFTLLVMLTPLTSGAQESDQAEGLIWVDPEHPSAIELAELNEEIDVAPPAQIYSVEMVFEEPARLDRIREVANQLQILRLLAYVEYGPSRAEYERSQVTIGLGAIYEGDEAWRREICKARFIAAATPGNAWLRTPAEQWMVKEMHVYGPAHAIRELRWGTFLPSASITEGGPEGARNPNGFISHTRTEMARKIQVPADRTVPEECREFGERREGPTLSGRPTIQSPDYGRPHNPEFRSLVLRLLADRSPETPVTMRIVFNSDVGIDDLAVLVAQYEIDGLTAELEPVDSDIRASFTAELGTHGGSMLAQVNRARCMMRLGVGAQITGEWLGRSATVSVPVSRAWDIVTHQELSNARLLAEFEAGALASVEAYHRRNATEPLRIPPGNAIPPGCDQYIQQRQ